MSQSLTMLSNIDSSLMNQQSVGTASQHGDSSKISGPDSSSLVHQSNSEDEDEDDKNGLSEDRKYRCTQCHHSFTRKHNLKSHMLIHTDEKPFECPHCSSKFRRQHDLKRHEKLHTGEKPYRCDKCDKRFARADALLRHTNSSSGCSGAGSGPGLDPSLSPGSSTGPVLTKRKSYDGQSSAMAPFKKSKDASNAEAAAAAAVASAVSNYYVQQAVIQTQQRQSRSRSTQQSAQPQVSLNSANSYIQSPGYPQQQLSNYGGSSSSDATFAELYGTIAILETKVSTLEARILELESKVSNAGH
ncbi:hypothetical protein OGAPHI_004162 [Ogataea philodendri]|uniref:C2H2-type domain-containing protein n=1 Tax=Ogataea philodendri TaxID=1378263 RepID=A0A9P8T4I1_9ASCO|nr:uncharacterized protein OGAPHI_004162 [Ogataea philodendri]KAH3665973.1 hypothetical protein OGAPHI_004162 [Ogataea philodendri]